MELAFFTNFYLKMRKKERKKERWSLKAMSETDRLNLLLFNRFTFQHFKLIFGNAEHTFKNTNLENVNQINTL